MANRLNRKKMIGIAAGALVAQSVLVGGVIQPLWSKNYSPLKRGNKDLISGALSADQMLFALAGFRELVAGILWVRADSFFDTGNFDAILPLIKLVTMLDPQAVDVYVTGMWHIGYNFTDEEQRSDRRYIPSALALGESGSRNNDQTYELFFETGWMWYHKVEDNFPKAVEWMQEAHKRKDIISARKRLLSRLYERNGQIRESLNHWYELLDESQKDLDLFTKENPTVPASSFSTARDVVERNLDTLLIRMAQRGEFARERGESVAPYDISPQADVNFSAKATFVAPNVLQVEGTYAVIPVGTRIRVVLRDKDYPNTAYALPVWDSDTEVKLDPPKDRTWMQELCFVRNQRFSKKIDMSRDPTMYPFTSKEYVLEFYYNPRQAPAHIQDKFGYNGEGMTDKLYLNREARPTIKDATGKVIVIGGPVIYAKFDVSRDMVKRRGDWSSQVPVLKTNNFVESLRDYNEDSAPVDIPTLKNNNPSVK